MAKTGSGDANFNEASFFTLFSFKELSLQFCFYAMLLKKLQAVPRANNILAQGSVTDTFASLPRNRKLNRHFAPFTNLCVTK